ncbi:DNA-binding SARP family transcriptional activator/tetratricopeptide (TPR) repeat protein [Actinoplanes lutulentus]|uniref:DNA-binding SARP family transcriptional activator n=1 Tax=Actinoplanes lutulentus TaxID=1287878 RepID=A0A327ZEE2_9ACTN|nr:AfsR/SARP family transcriptional regulator [Actinoplanes lutulentus]MBB2945756.1 DNA-binding SARP family transcriptional activator/tetratricopeptide (TPR) repeat protein [Actinoplanes lutulentus]RAK37805.1 DNA-binding SARP family transcriptional activator [Actinoplanes lutulentus]
MTTLRYGILGPLSVTVDEQKVAITAGRDRVVLAMLLLRPGRIVGPGELIEAVWGADPPATARGQLQTCVSRLRRVLPAGVILSDPAGYGIRPGEDELDATVFLRLVEQARAAEDPGAARRAYKKALDLWKGDACAEIDAPAVRAAAASLDERRAMAVEDWAGLELAAGQARELLGELAGWVERFPLRERLRGQLMTALDQAGRKADALAEFRRTRDVLREELGIEPGHELQELHRSILAGTARKAVRCLPRTVGDFTGRTALVDRLLAQTETDDPAVLVIDGMAGSGKTTLALHLATAAGERFPDAHLYVDLRGYSEQPPVEPAAALIVLLRQLGLAPADIPLDPVDRIGLWRTEMARRKVLVVLDNAAGSSQVTDLLPSSPGSLTLVTTRRRLAGLDGARVESLPLLESGEAVALLQRIAGDRVAAEPKAAAEVVRRCGGLPLAVRLAGARLVHRPRWRVADLLLRMGGTALPELAAEDRTVTGAFSLTYRQLPELPRDVFRLLGIHPGASFDALAVAALAGISEDAAAGVLDDLVDVHLVDEPEPGLFRLHDLLRQYAGALAGELPAEERLTALNGALDFQLNALIAAASPGHRGVLLGDIGDRKPERPDLMDALGDPGVRLERQRPNLAAFVEAAAAAGLHDYTWQIVRASWPGLFVRAYMDDVRDLHLLAMEKIEHSGDRFAIAVTANYLASVYARAGEHEKAERYLLQSARVLQDLNKASNVYANLGMIYRQQGRFAESVEAVRTCFRLATLSRGWAGKAVSAFAVIAASLHRLGRTGEALHYTHLRLMYGIETKDRGSIAGSLLAAGRFKYAMGTIGVERALYYVTVAMRLAEQAGFRAVLADANNDRARLLRDSGRCAEAVAAHQRALDFVVEARDALHESEFRNDYADTLRLCGDVTAARAMYGHALRIATAARLPYPMAHAQAGLAACLDHDDPEAVRLRANACELFNQMGITTIDGSGRIVERG